MAAQARRQTAEAVEDLYTVDSIGGEATADVGVASPPRDAHSRGTNGVGSTGTRTASTPAAQARYGSPAAARRGATPSTRVASASRSARARTATPALSLEEEMYYVRTDIRRLVMLTVICIAVLVVLSFILR
jgi:hypothetical protein